MKPTIVHSGWFFGAMARVCPDHCHRLIRGPNVAGGTGGLGLQDALQQRSQGGRNRLVLVGHSNRLYVVDLTPVSKQENRWQAWSSD